MLSVESTLDHHSDLDLKTCCSFKLKGLPLYLFYIGVVLSEANKIMVTFTPSIHRVNVVSIRKYSRFRLIGPPVNRVSRLIGPNCYEQNPIKDNALR